MPAALHLTHNSQVDCGLLNVVAVYPLRRSRYVTGPSSSPASDTPCELGCHKFVKVSDRGL